MNNDFVKEKYMVHEIEPKEEIDRCLNCPYPDCTDTCVYSPFYRVRKPKPKLTPVQRYIARLKPETKERAGEVARLFMDGWCEGGIAWKLSITRTEVVESLKVAKKMGLLD